MIYLKLFFIFFKIGLLGFGGGYAILPMIYQDIQTFGILSHDDFSNLVALSQVTPGPIAINAATFVGFKVAGVAGAAVATTAVSLPSFFIIVLVVAFLRKFKENTTVQAVLQGIRPATIGLIASAFIFLARAALLREDALNQSDVLSSVDINGVVVFVITLVLLRTTRTNAIRATLLGAVLGLLFGTVWG